MIKKYNDMLTKTITAKVADLDDQGQVKFQFSKFDFIDTDDDITRKGAFKKSMLENLPRIKHFKNHWRDSTPGVIKELYETAEGAFAISQLIIGPQGKGSALGNDTYAEYKAGAITEHSYGYDIIKANQITVDNKQVQELVELRLKEVSSLNAWGASEHTPTLEVKSEKDIIDFLDRLEKLKEGDFTKEYFKQLELKIAAVHDLLKTLAKPDTKVITLEPYFEIMKHSTLFK